MQYGWYLLDDTKRGLITSSALRDIVPYGPFHVEFQPMGLDGTAMDYQRFTELVDELAAMNLRSVRLAGGGEPLSHARAIEMVRYLATSGVAIAEIETDALRLNDEMIVTLLDIRAHTLVTRRQDGVSPDSRDVAANNLQRLRDAQSQRRLDLPKILSEPDRQSDSSLRHCYIPWYHMLIDAHFDVWPCRFLAGEDFGALGNVRDEAAAAVWNGPRAREYRAAFRRGAAPLDTVSRASSTDGFALPALRAFRERVPRSQFVSGSMELVTRIHAEAEMARIEALRLRVRAAQLETQATSLARTCADAAGSEHARVEAATIKRMVGALDSYSEQLFQESCRVGGLDLVRAAPPAFDSMRDWLRQLHAIDPSVSPDVDHTFVLWSSLFKTLADTADMSVIQRVLGVGVGAEGPEIHYNDHFPEHHCLDIYDYSDRNPTLKFVTANIEERVPFPDAYFDLVYSHSVFEHLKDMPRAMAEIDRLLGVGKYVYITVCPLYYSPAGSHVNLPQPLTNWEHLYPGSEHYLLETPDPTRIHEGVFLNRMTIADFLEQVGRVGWEILHFSLRIVHPLHVPSELKERYPLVDLVVQEYRFVGRKVIPR